MDADQLDLKITGHEAADRTRRLCLRLPSHCPEEWTEPDDIAVCLAALTAAVIRLDEELAP